MPVNVKNSDIVDIIRSASGEEIVFNLLCGTTEISLIPGISAAGSNPEMTYLTPTLDSEIISAGKCMTLPIPPMTPEGIPTPALITRAALEYEGIQSVIIDAGMKTPPRVPFFHTGAGTARDPALGTALPNFQAAFEAGRYLGRILEKKYRVVTIGESLPGGTTTSYFILRALGMDLPTSSSLPSDPSHIKLERWEKAKSRIEPADLTPYQLIAEYGDYTQAIALGMLDALDGTPVILFGGTQMAAIYYISDLMGQSCQKYLSTTSWVYSHRKETIDRLVEKDNRLLISEMTFNGSTHEGLRMYDLGHVREGAGMGGSFMLSSLRNRGDTEIYKEIDRLYGQFQ